MTLLLYLTKFTGRFKYTVFCKMIRIVLRRVIAQSKEYSCLLYSVVIDPNKCGFKVLTIESSVLLSCLHYLSVLEMHANLPMSDPAINLILMTIFKSE